MNFFSQYYYYINFFCGCSFLFLALSCFLLWRVNTDRSRYLYVVLSGFVFAAENFLRMFGAVFGTLYDINLYFSTLSIVSYTAIFFFFLSAHKTYLITHPSNKLTGYLAAGLSLICATAGVCLGEKIFNIFVLLLMYIPSSIIMTAALNSINKEKKILGQKLYVSCIGIFCFLFSLAKAIDIFYPYIIIQSLFSSVFAVTLLFISSGVFKYFKIFDEQTKGHYDYMPGNWRRIPIGILLFFILTAGLLFSIYLEDYARDTVEANADAIVLSVVENVNSQLKVSDKIAEVLSASPTLSENLSTLSVRIKNNTDALLDAYCETFDIRAIWAVNATGDVVFSSKLLKEYGYLKTNFKDKSYFKNVMRSGAYGTFDESLSEGNVAYFSSSGIKNKENKIIGAVILQNDMKETFSLLGQHKNIFIIDKNNAVLLSAKERSVFEKPQKEKKHEEKFISTVLSEEIYKDDTIFLDGQRYYAAKNFLDRNRWSVVYFASLALIAKFRILSISIICAAVIIVLLLFRSISQSNRILALALQHKAILGSAKNIMIIATDIAGNIVVYGQGAEDLTGYSFDEFVKKGIRNIIFDKNGDSVSFEEAVLFASSPNTEFICKCKNGTEINILVSILPQYSDSGKLLGYVFSGTDITASKETESELSQQIKFLQMLIDSMPIAVYYKDRDLHIAGCNKTFELIMEHSKEFMIGKKNENIYFDAQALEKSKRTDEIVKSEMSSITYEKNVKFMESEPRNLIYYKYPYKRIDGEFGGIIGIILDITKERKLQAERDKIQAIMIQQNKLASLGELAGGIAHELNNPLSIILGFAQVLMKDKTLSADSKNGVKNIYNSAERSKNIIANMLRFAGTNISGREFVSVNDIIGATVVIIEKEFKKAGIEIYKKLLKEEVFAAVNPMQIQQVFLNILLNAKDAMPKGGKIDIETKISDKYFVINISDTGAGMEKDVVSKIFEPFFTTKPAGKGTGLGLSICYGIITAHNGSISVKSRKDKGTTFTIKLPLGTPAESEKSKK